MRIRTISRALCVGASTFVLAAPALGQTPPPPPANDTCATPLSITGFGTWVWDNTDATASMFDGGNPVFCNPGFGPAPPHEDMFFVWTAHTADEIRFHCCGSWGGTAMSLHAGNDCNAVCIEGTFQGVCESQLDAEIIYTTVAGSNYLIQVGQWGVALGPPPFTLTVELSVPPPFNDTCSTAVGVVGPGLWAMQRQLATTSLFDGGDPDNCASADSGLAPSMDVFFQWTAATSGRKRFRTCGSGVDQAMSIYAGLGCAATCLASSDDGPCADDGTVEIVLEVVAGETFLIQIGSDNQFVVPSAGEFLQVIHVNPPGNDYCWNPVPVGIPGTYTYGTQNAGTSGFDGGDPTLCHSPANINSTQLVIERDIFYTFTVPCPGNTTITLNPTLLDPAMGRISVHAGSDCSATCVASGPGTSSTDPFTIPLNDLQQGDSYLVQVGAWSYSSELGNGTFTISPMVCPVIGTITTACSPAQLNVAGLATTLTGSFTDNTNWPLLLEAVDGPPGSFGFFVVGPTEADPITMLPVHQGILCLKLPIGRYHPVTANLQGLPKLNSVGRFDDDGIFENLSSTGEAGYGFRVPEELPFHPGQMVISAGDRYSFQLWYRDFDAGGAASGNLSDLIQVMFP